MREKEQEKFDGISTDWQDYIISFEQVADWNNWNECERAQQLVMCLIGNAQKLLSECMRTDLQNYQRLKNVLGRRYNPVEREVAFRCKCKSRKMNQPQNLHYEMKKHVQFHHPLSLDQANAYAMEYEAFDGSLNRVKKPQYDSELERSMAAMHMYQSRASRVILEQVEDLIDKKIEKFKNEITNLLKNPTYVESQIKPRSDIVCGFCKAVGHTESRCFKKNPNLRPTFNKPESRHLNG